MTAPIKKRGPNPLRPGKTPGARYANQKKYAASMQKRGLTQVKMWVPAEHTQWFHDMAEDFRSARRMGLDPFTIRSSLPAAAELPPRLLPLLDVEGDE